MRFNTAVSAGLLVSVSCTPRWQRLQRRRGTASASGLDFAGTHCGDRAASAAEMRARALLCIWTFSLFNGEGPCCRPGHEVAAREILSTPPTAHTSHPRLKPYTHTSG
jgi:hypothetical protein